MSKKITYKVLYKNHKLKKGELMGPSREKKGLEGKKQTRIWLELG